MIDIMLLIASLSNWIISSENLWRFVKPCNLDPVKQIGPFSLYQRDKQRRNLFREKSGVMTISRDRGSRLGGDISPSGGRAGQRRQRGQRRRDHFSPKSTSETGKVGRREIAASWLILCPITHIVTFGKLGQHKARTKHFKQVPWFSLCDNRCCGNHDPPAALSCSHDAEQLAAQENTFLLPWVNVSRSFACQQTGAPELEFT